MATINPNTAIWNAGDLYLQGMGLTWVSTTQITVAQGQARDSTNLNDIFLQLPPENNGTPITTPFTLDNTLNGAGGLDTGTVAASTLYYVYAIASSQNSTINLPPSPQQSLAVPPFTTPDPTDPVVQDAYYVQANVVMSLSATTPLLPFGYDMFRYIGTVATDGSSHFRRFIQYGTSKSRTILYDPGTGPSTTGVAIPSSPTTGSATYINVGVLTSLVPQKEVECIFDVSLTGSSAADAVYMAPATIDNGTTATVGSMASFSADVASLATKGQLRCPVSLPNSTQRAALTIGAVVTALIATTTTNVMAVALSGYVDNL
jgi:hypothetical protein